MKTEKANPLIIRHSIRHIIESIFNMFLQHFMIWKVVVAYKIYYKDILRINIVTKQTLHHVSITDMVFGLWILNTFHFFSSLRTTKLWCATLKHLCGIFFYTLLLYLHFVEIYEINLKKRCCFSAVNKLILT